MPVVPMQKVALTGHQQSQDEVLSLLQKMEVMEISPLSPESSKIAEGAELQTGLAEIKSAIDLLEKISGKKKSFIESFAPQKELIQEEFLEQTAREFDWRSLINKIKGDENKLANLKKLENTLGNELKTLSPWQELTVELSQLACRAKTCITAGSCKPKEYLFLKEKLGELSPALHIETVNITKEKIHLLIFHLAAEAKIINDLLSKINFEKASLPSVENTPASEIARIKNLLSKTREEQIQILKELKSLMRHKPALSRLYDYLSLKQLKKTAQEKSAYTQKTFLLTGWVPQKKFAFLKSSLQKVTPLCEVRTIQPEKNEVPPTLIKNSKVFYPFELITRIFGLPSQHEIDPTGPLSFFYLLFFAMCLSDVGYGVILSIVSFYYLRKLTLSEGGKKLLLLLFWGGIATVAAGILTGSYFGIESSYLPAFLKRLQIIDPIKNPLNVLVLSLLLGVSQNLTGVAIAMYWKIKNREYITALLDYGLWIYFLLMLVFFAVAAGLGSPETRTFRELSVTGGILLVLTQGRHEPTLLKKAISGILSLYRTTSYLGDTLSYSRLLALMMTTSIIGMVVNIIAGLTKDSIPILGYVIMFAILIFGHALNFVVSVLGAFIHSTRLQLVEFFGKFYEGRGREFRPFGRETKYVMIK